MKKILLVTTALVTLLFAFTAHAVLPTLYLTNQFGEQSINRITGGSGSVVGCTTADTIVSNLTGGAAAPLCNTYTSVSAKLPVANGTLVATGSNLETVSAAGAISTSKLESALANATGSDFAVTLAAPSSQDGQLKILKMTVRTSNNITMALTNVAFSGAYTPTGTTTLTFSAVGQSAVFIAVGSKWVYLGGSAVAS